MNIQKELDALEQSSGGGILTPPPDDYRGQGVILLPDHCIVRGSGFGVTTLRAATGKYWGERRQYGCRLEDVDVYGTGEDQYAAVEWRNISRGGMKNVRAGNAKYGMLVTNSSLYNYFDNNDFGGSEEAVELYGSDYEDAPNANTFMAGKMDAPLCLKIQSCNGSSFLSVSMEPSGPDAASATFRHLIDAPGHHFVNCRNEKQGYGPVWITETAKSDLRL